MKWRKLGKIFDPTQHSLPANCAQFAQSPQALVFDNYVRIYFSTRENDQPGKFLSHISFVDFDKQLKNILKVSNDTVIPLGTLGTFDEHGIFPMNVLRHKDKILGFTSGISRRVSVPVETSIGIAISNDDGNTFQRYGEGPVLTSSLYEPFLVGDPFVLFIENKFHMWYIFGTKWIKNAEKDGAPSRVYKIAHATSKDGINWGKDGKLLLNDKLGDYECQALPTVFRFGDRYHMIFCYREAIGFRNEKGKGYRLGYAVSDDLINWIRKDDDLQININEGEWDSNMMCYPHVFSCDDQIYMLYNGNEFGKYGFGAAILENI